MEKIHIVSDNWTVTDGLGYKSYANALAETIISPKTGTPITLGIHGKWGAGKTSLMRMVENKLKNKAKTIWFDAWVYSKEEVLWTALLQSVVSVIVNDEEFLNSLKNETEKTLRSKLASLVRNIGLIAAEVLMRRITYGKSGVDFFKKKSKGKTEDEKEEKSEYQKKVEFLSGLKGEMKDLIGHYAEGKKVVMFIDDLDRCLPEKAVDVLEALKLFLDVEGCVFVLGVERDIIERGIEVKYKEFLNLPERGAEYPRMPISGESYIEKLIQLAFGIPPLTDDDVIEFIKSLSIRDDFKKYASIIVSGVQKNPRKIKRFMNSLELQWFVAMERHLLKDEKQKELFIKFCILQTWRDFFDDLKGIRVRINKRLAHPLLKKLEYLVTKASDEEKEKEFKGSSVLKKHYNNDALSKFIRAEPHFENADISQFIYVTEVVGSEAKPGEEETEKNLIAELMSGDYLKVSSAAEKIAEKSIDEVISRLLEFSKDKDESVKVNATEALESLEDKIPEKSIDEVIRRLLELSKDKTEYVKWRAASAFGSLKVKIPEKSIDEVITRLLELSKDKAESVRERAAGTFRSLKDRIPEKSIDEVIKKLLELSKHEFTEARGLAAWMFGALSEKKKIPQESMESVGLALRSCEADKAPAFDPDDTSNWSTIAAIARKALIKHEGLCIKSDRG